MAKTPLAIESVSVSVLDRMMVSGFGKYATDHDGATPEALTEISFTGIRALIDNPAQGVAKDRAQWCIPSLYHSRKGQDTHGRFVMLWLDIDEPEDRNIQQIAEIVAAVVEGCDFEIYASRSATEAKQKCRVLIPLSAELTPDQWMLASDMLRAKMAAAGVQTDPATKKPGQVLYLPNAGDFYATANQRSGDLFQPLIDWAREIADRKAELEQQAKEIATAQEAAKQARAALKQSRTAQGFKSLIEAFNAAYDVADILLQHGYKQRGNTFMHPNSQTGSYSATVKNGRFHSLSTSDPLHTDGAGAHDAFSVFVKLAHNGNEAAALIDAGDNWLTVGAESWNKVSQREYMQRKNQEPHIDFAAMLSKHNQAGAAVIPEPDEDGVINGYTGGATFPPLEPSPYDTPPNQQHDVKQPPLAFKFVPIGDMLKSPKPVTYLVDELIEHPSLGLIFGPHSCGKSFITLSMAACVATGTPWMDRPVTQGAVFYLAGEGHAGISRRLMGWSVHSGVPLDNAPLFVSEVPARLMDEQAALDVTLAIEGMAQHYGVKPALIVIDTFARNMGNGDENSNADAGLFISHIDAMRTHVGATVLLVHHSGHNPDAQDRGRGASSLGAAMDCIFQITKDGDHITVTARKTKEDAIPKPMPLELAHPVQLPSHWVDAKGRVMTTAVAIPSNSPPPKTERLTPAVRLALDTYHQAACELGEWDKAADVVRVQLEDWQTVFYKKSTADSQDAKRMAFKRARKDLTERGIVTVDNYVYIMPASDKGLNVAKFVHGQTAQKD